MQVTILGSGNMGTALAKIIADNGQAVKIWNTAKDPEPLQQIKKYHENKKYLPQIKLPSNIKGEAELKTALAGADVVIVAVPSQFVEPVCRQAAPYFKTTMVYLCAAKGLTPNLKPLSSLIVKYLPTGAKTKIGSLSGPAIARDFATGKFAAMNLATKNDLVVKRAIRVLQNEHLKIIPTTDVIGADIGGSFKNVYAIALGIASELQYPLNTISALTVTALKELAQIIVAAGGRAETALDLAGAGDLIGTGLSPHSRNHRFGRCLARGLCTTDAMAEIKQAVEGVAASSIINKIVHRYRLQLPLAAMVARCVKGKPANLEIKKFLKKYS